MEDKKLTFDEELALSKEIENLSDKEKRDILKNVPEEELALLKEIKGHENKKLNNPIDKESILFNLCFDVFYSGIETGKKIGLDVDDKLKSPKKGTVLFESFEFEKVYKEVIQKYCENNQKY